MWRTRGGLPIRVSTAAAPTLRLHAEPSEYTFVSSCAVYKVTGLHGGVGALTWLRNGSNLKRSRRWWVVTGAFKRIQEPKRHFCYRPVLYLLGVVIRAVRYLWGGFSVTIVSLFFEFGFVGSESWCSGGIIDSEPCPARARSRGYPSNPTATLGGGW